MSTPPLTPTSYLVLGTLATNGPATPYELKQAVAAGVGYFWTFPHSQLYSESARLASTGLVTEEREDHGRRRRIYSITPAGRAALSDWLGDPGEDLPEIRDIGLLKLFFGDLAAAPELRALAEHQRDAHQARLALYEQLEQAAIPGAAGSTLGLGIAWERAATQFWKNIVERPPAGP